MGLPVSGAEGVAETVLHAAMASINKCRYELSSVIYVEISFHKDGKAKGYAAFAS